MSVARGRRPGSTPKTTEPAQSRPAVTSASGRLYPSLALQIDPTDVAQSSQAARSLASYLPLQGPFAAFDDAPVMPVAGLIREQGALAQTRSGEVEIDSELPRLPPEDVEKVLTHETVHLAQQQSEGGIATAGALEAEANRLTPAILHGDAAWPSLSASSQVPLKQEPSGSHGPTAGEISELNRAFEAATGGASRRRQDHLRAQQEYIRRLRQLVVERNPIETNRLILDRYSLDQLAVEELSIGQANRRPISISVSPDQIQFVVRFQVRFRGLSMEAARQQFPILQQNLRAGLSQVWGQRLDQLPSLVRNREFLLTPVIDLISADAPRNPDYWLVDVDASVARALTDPAEGIMRISPNNVGEPDTLGHESLHLFGLIDRYIDNLTTGRSMGFRGSGRPGFSTGTTRGDPLDIGHGPILSEDLEFLFVQLDVYERVILDDLPPYHAALMRHLGWGHAPRFRQLMLRAGNTEDPSRSIREMIDRASNEVLEALTVETERDRLRREAALPVPRP